MLGYSRTAIFVGNDMALPPIGDCQWLSAGLMSSQQLFKWLRKLWHNIYVWKIISNGLTLMQFNFNESQKCIILCAIRLYDKDVSVFETNARNECTFLWYLNFLAHTRAYGSQNVMKACKWIRVQWQLQSGSGTPMPWKPIARQLFGVKVIRFTLRAAAEQTLASAGCRGRTTDSFSSAAALNKRNHKLCVNHYISKAKFTQQAHAT